MISRSILHAGRPVTFSVAIALVCVFNATATAESVTYFYTGNPFTQFDGEPLFDSDDHVTARFSIDCSIAHAAGDCRNLPFLNYFDLGAVSLEPMSFTAGPAALPTADGRARINTFHFSTDANGNIVDWDTDLDLEHPSGIINVDTDNVGFMPIDSAAALGAFANNIGIPGNWRRVRLGGAVWAEGNGHIYAIIEFPEASWQDAYAEVKTLLPGYHLATVTSEAEEIFIEQLLIDVTGSSAWEWWLGGFQDVEVETDPAADWQWVTGEAWTYTDWRDGEPNDAGGIEDYLALDNGAWNDEGSALGAIRGYIVELGTFDDVPAAYWAFDFVETLYRSGITSGCGARNFCPDDHVKRAQMAVFLVRAMHGSAFVPLPALGNLFLDVGAGDFAAAYIEQLYGDAITRGCGNNNYCPDASVTRAQMAVFLLRALHGSDYAPPPAVGVFEDVDLAYWAVSWIEQLAAEGITVGCGSGNYCPEAPVTRAQIAVFLVRTFGL